MDSRTRGLTRGNCDRIILINVGLASCNGSGVNRFGVYSTIRAIDGVSNVGHVHLNSLRPSRVASRVLLELHTISGFYPRFRLSLRSNYSRALGHVGHRCSDTFCHSLIKHVHDVFASTTVAASVVINFTNRARSRFSGDLDFTGRVDFTGTRVFTCSEQYNAVTCGVPDRIAGTRGAHHDHRVVGTATGDRRSFVSSCVNGAMRILFRSARGNFAINCAGGCLHMGIGDSGTRANRVLGMGLASGSNSYTMNFLWCGFWALGKIGGVLAPFGLYGWSICPD